MTRAFLGGVVLAGLLFAPSLRAESDKARMVFPAGGKEPLATPTPAPTATPAPGPRPEPAEAIELFFRALKAEKVDAAYDGLVKGTIITERPDDVKALKAKTQQAIDSYGLITGYEVIDEQVVGKVLLRRTCLSLNTDLPLRWRFYFYHSGGVWKLVDIRIDDGLAELFEPRK